MKINPNPSVVLIGSVNSSRRTLEKLIEHKMNVSGVLGLHPDASKNVSGYFDLKDLAESNGIPFQYFTKVNAPEVVTFLEGRKVDFLFVIGLSQMVQEPLLSIPAHGCIGFHPTRLPEGRGRGAVAWIVLGMVEGAATLFHMDAGMDSGPVWVQENYEAGPNDYAQDVVNNITNAINKGLDKVLPKLKEGEFITVPQDESKATYLAKRNPEDGLIDWNRPAEDIYRLVRAVSRPLPGAYTYAGVQPLKIYRASVSAIKNHLGVPGRVIIASEAEGIHVQTGNGLLKLEEFEGVEKEKLKVGYSLGLNIEKEFFKVLERLEKLESLTGNTNN